VRCDEHKPACKRCITTGRKCDGYGTLPSHPLPRGSGLALDIIRDPPLHPTGRPTKESRSYRFFLEVMAPSLAGAMHNRFWLDEIPRLCHQDLAVWHAIVSLSSAHESYVSGVAPGRDPFQSGYNLLREFDTESTLDNSDRPLNTSPRDLPSASAIPISLSTLRSILIGFEMRNNKLNSTRISQLPTLLSRDDSISRWTSYAAPHSPSASGNYVTVASLGEAMTTAEVLFYHLALSSQQYANEMKRFYAAGKNILESSRSQISHNVSQRAHRLCFKEIQKAIEIFNAEFGLRRWPRAKAAEQAQLRRAFLPLRLMHATNRFMLREDPDTPDEVKRSQTLPALCVQIVDLAEEMMSLERTYGCKRSGDSIPNSTVMNPLYTVARSGFGAETRQRAMKLLRCPRVEGLWDSAMAASLANAVMLREKTASQEYWKREEMKGICIDDYTPRGWKAEAAGQDSIHPLARLCNSTMSFGKGRRASIGLRTWWEWLEDLPGQEVMIQW
ncbi:hypothetical protein S7711_10223, partial [Stachybotrys chartarum IBT 7711]